MMFSKLFFVLVASVAAVESPAAQKTAGAMHKKKKNSDDAHLAREIDGEGNLVMDQETEAKNDHLRQDDSSSYVEKVDKKVGGKKHKKHHKASDEDKPENPKIQPVFVEKKAHKADNDTDAAADEKAAAYGLPIVGTFSLVAGAAVLL